MQAALKLSLIAALSCAVLTMGACSAETSDPAEQPAVTDRAATPETGADPTPMESGLLDVRYYELDKSCPYCRDVKALIQGAKRPRKGDPEPLEKTYEGKVAFSIRPAYDARNEHVKEVEPFKFGPAGHGMVAIGPDGAVLFTIEGHHINRAAIMQAIDATLE